MASISGRLLPTARMIPPSRGSFTRDQEIDWGVVLLQEHHVRRHVRVNSGKIGLVAQLDDEHRRLACIKHTAG